jgi:hypothetical protein
MSRARLIYVRRIVVKVRRLIAGADEVNGRFVSSTKHLVKWEGVLK